MIEVCNYSIIYFPFYYNHLKFVICDDISVLLEFFLLFFICDKTK